MLIVINANVERAISLGAKIEAARKHLQSLEAEMASLVGASNRPAAMDVPLEKSEPAQPQTGRGFTFAQLETRSIPERILERMRLAPARSFSSEDFKELTSETTIQNIRSSLVRLASFKKIVKISRGKYRLAPAQASLPNVAATQK